MNKGFKEFLFEDIVNKNKGFLRGPFGGSLKKEIFVPKGENTYKVYEQGVVLRKNIEIGDYYIKEEYFNQTMYRFEVCPKDFLVSCSGANYGAIFQMPENIETGIINQALLRIRLNNKLINDKYFDYFFSHHLVNQIIGKKGDSTIPNFPPVSVLKKLKIKIHSCINYQKQIAKVLSDLDAKIEVNNKINAELEAMAKLIYDYWFVQFDFPFDFAQGKPDPKGKPYKSSGGKMVYNKELKREIPEGWDVDIIGNLLTKDKKTTKIPSSEYLENGKIPIIDQSTKFICGYTNEENSLIETYKPRIVFGDHTRIVKLINFDFARGADGTQVLLSNNSRMPQHLFYHVLLKIDLSNYGYARHFKFLKDTKVIIPQLEIANRRFF